MTKTLRLDQIPVKFIAEVQYSVIRSEIDGTEWKFLFRFAPVIRSRFAPGRP